MLFAAGLLSKSVAMTLPLLLVQWWRRGQGGRVTPVDLLRVAPLVVLGAVITAADLAFYRGGNRRPDAEDRRSKCLAVRDLAAAHGFAAGARSRLVSCSHQGSATWSSGSGFQVAPSSATRCPPPSAAPSTSARPA